MFLAACASAQARDLAPDLANWEEWTAGVAAALADRDIDRFVASLHRVDRLRTVAPTDARRQRANAAWARLAWRVHRNEDVLARLGVTAEGLLVQATRAAEEGGSSEDAGYATLELAMRTAGATERRELLEAASGRDFGRLSHGPWVLLAQLDLQDRNFEKASAHLRTARHLLQRVEGTPWMLDTYHAICVQEALQYGLLDVARQHLMSVGSKLTSESTDRLWLSYLMAAEDFEAAVVRGEKILRLSTQLDLAEIERLVAMAMFRDLRVSLADDRRPLRRLEQALARPCADATRAQISIDLAFMHVELADFPAAEARLADASAALVSIGESDIIDLRTRLVTVQTYLALTRGDGRAALAALHGELSHVCDEILAQWRKIPVRKGGLGFLQFAERRDAIAALVATEYELYPEQPERALGHLMRAQAQGTFARRQQVPVGEPARVREVLVAERGVLFVFLPCALGECVFVITRERIEFHRLPRADTLLRDLRSLRSTLLPTDSLSSADEVATCAERVASKILPAAVRRQLARWDECVIVGRELLCDLPFEVLPGPASRWLGCDLALSYLPSLPFGLHRAQRTPDGDRVDARCALIAVTPPDGSAAREDTILVGESALDEILSPWPDGMRLSGGEATAAAVGRPDVTRSAMTILLAHGRDGLATEDDERARGMTMVGAPLSCGRIENLRRDGVAPFVVLAVCRGATGLLRRGEDTGSHLAGAFLFAGADAVVAADADLDVAATTALLRVLSRHRAEGHGAAEAMRLARASLAATDEFAHPVFHSLLGVFGHEPRRPPAVLKAAAASHSATPWTVAGVASILAVGWMVAIGTRRRRLRRVLPNRAAADPAAAAARR